MITQEELQGLYDVTYASNPPLEDFYEPGFGSAKIEGNTLKGVDALGVIWDATYQISDSGEISYKAVLDPKNTPPTVVLIDKNGQISREPQDYEGNIDVIKTDAELVLHTRVHQGHITIDVQFRKKP